MPGTPNRPLRVLVVDDNRAHCYALAKRLNQVGFQVRQAYDGYSALRGSRGFPDVILMDINMPGLDGFEVCRRVKTDPASAHIPVVLFSATVNIDECRAQARKAGGVDLFPAADAINMIQFIQSLVAKSN